MRQKLPLFIGGGLALLLMAVAGWYFTRDTGGGTPGVAKGPALAINCYGAEKTVLMGDSGVQKVLKDKYNITVTFNRRGSYEVAQTSTADLKAQKADCIWPSSASAQKVFESLHKSSDFTGYRAESIFQVPEVIYAGVDATNALVKAGIVQERGGNYFIIDLKKLMMDYVLQHKRWQDLNAANMGGPIRITSPDPRTSNTGFTLTQLELTTIASGDPYQPPTVADVKSKKALPIIQAVIAAQGLQGENSDAELNNWLIQGTQTLHAGYENQLLRLVAEYREQKDTRALGQLKDQTRVLYPEPTLFSTHPLIALTPNGAKLIDAMKDPEIQRIAWEEYGFRSGTSIGGADVSKFPELKLASKPAATNPPGADVTLLTLNCITGKGPCE